MKKGFIAFLAIMLTALGLLINIVVDILESHGAAYPKITFYLALAAGGFTLAAFILSIRGEKSR